MTKSRISKSTYERLANFRYELRKFIHFSEAAARQIGITPQQHQVLLAIKGFPERDVATPRELAERLRLSHNACVGLIDRCEQLGLVCRMPNPKDKRSVYVGITEHGTGILEQLSEIHLEEIKRIGLFKYLE